jgi:hypothetical protein
MSKPIEFATEADDVFLEFEGDKYKILGWDPTRYALIIRKVEDE